MDVRNNMNMITCPYIQDEYCSSIFSALPFNLSPKILIKCKGKRRGTQAIHPYIYTQYISIKHFTGAIPVIYLLRPTYRLWRSHEGEFWESFQGSIRNVRSLESMSRNVSAAGPDTRGGKGENRSPGGLCI